MTTGTRRFVMTSLLVLTAGVGVGLVAYYFGVSPDGVAAQAGTAELQLVPPDATFVGYVNVRRVIDSPLRQQLPRALPPGQDGRQEFETETGISIDRDIDAVTAYLAPADAGEPFAAGGLVLVRGRFVPSKVEALMRDRGAAVEDYKGRRIIVAERPPAADQATASAAGRGALAVAFVEPGLAAIGSPRLVRGAIDRQDGSANVGDGAEVMGLVRSVDGGDLWAVSRFDVLSQEAPLPPSIAGQLPAITWLTVSARVDTGLRGVLRAEARDEKSATALRDAVRGFLALVKLQAPKVPGAEALLQSFELQGTGSTVALSFDAPAELLDGLRPSAERAIPRPSR